MITALVITVVLVLSLALFSWLSDPIDGKKVSDYWAKALQRVRFGNYTIAINNCHASVVYDRYQKGNKKPYKFTVFYQSYNQDMIFRRWRLFYTTAFIFFSSKRLKRNENYQKTYQCYVDHNGKLGMM